MSIAQGFSAHIFWVIRSFISWQSLFLFACATILCAIWQVIQFRRRRNGEEKTHTLKHLICVYIFLLYLTHVYRLTGLVGLVWWLRSPLIALDRIGLIPFAISGSIVPELLNIIMTIPLGFLLPAIWPEFRFLKKVMLAGFLFSLTIEALQLFTLRFSTTGDLITNTLGAIIGYFIFLTLSRLFGRVKKDNEQIVSRVMRYEAIVYIALSLIGVVFLYHPAITMRLPTQGVHMESVESGIGRELSEGMEYALMIVTEISGSQVQGEVLRRLPLETFDTAILSFIVSDSTSIRISEGRGQNHRFIFATIDDILLGDLIDVFIYRNGDEFFAVEVTITRE